MGFREIGNFLLNLTSLVSGLRESVCKDEGPFDVFIDALLDGRKDIVSVGGNDRQVHRFGQLQNTFKTGQAENVTPIGIDWKEPISRKTDALQVSEDPGGSAPF